MAPVGLDIDDVVEEIDRRSQQAEGDEGDCACPSASRSKTSWFSRIGMKTRPFLSQ
jgi:hypothetical protein